MTLHRYLARLIWLCIAPLLLLAAWMAVENLRQAESRREQEANHLAHNVAASIDRHIGAQMGALQMLAASPLVDAQAGWNGLYQEAQGFRRSFGNHVLLADTSGQMLLNTRLPLGSPLPRLPQVSGRAAGPTALRTGAPAVGDQFIGPVAKERVVAVAVPVLRDGRATHLLLSVIESRQFQQRLDELALPAEWTMSLLDGKDEVIARRAAAMHATTADTRRFVVRSSLSPWSVVVEVPSGLSSLSTIAAAVALASMILAATLTGVFGGRVASRQLARSLTSLTELPVAAGTTPDIAEVGAIRRLMSDAAQQREQAEATRRESEERFRRLFEQAPLPLVFMDSGGRLGALNLRFCQTFGYTQADIPTREEWWRLAFPDPDYRALAMASWNAARERAPGRGNVIDGGEYRVVCKDGRERVVLISGIMVEGGMLAAYFDITARKRAEAELQESEARYRDMFEANPHPMWVYDLGSLAFLAVNDAAVSHYGYRCAEFLAMTIADIRPGEDLPRLQEVVAGISGGLDNIGVWRHRRRDGSEILVEITAHPLAFAGRRAMVVLAHDVTQRVHAEQQLRKLSAAVEQSPESIVITDLDANIEYVNNAFTRVTGYRPEEVIGQNPRILQSGRTPPDVYVALWDALTEGQSWKGEFYNTRRDGTEYVELAIITPIRQPDGRITHYVAVKEDITQRKKLGEELDHHRHHLEELVEHRTAELELAKASAETANVAKTAFLANMSHEIRTPMNAILGFAHLLKRSGLTPAQSERLDKIESAGEHLLSVINNILDISKIEADKLVLEQTDFALSSILERVRALIAEPADAKGLSVSLDYDAVPTHLQGDPTRLRQALLNFASNAVKFTERGTVCLRVRLLEERGDKVLTRFEVEDTGIGIPPDKLPGLFRAFEQVDASTTRKFGGTGLGLAITRWLAGLMGGETGVESQAGVGSTFWFTAWLGRGREETPAPAAPTAEDGESLLRRRYFGARILLAEDDPINQEVALTVLADTGLHIEVAGTGREAVDKVAHAGYDLVLMDMQMPQMDGLEATRAIRALPAGASLPIVAMTANAFDEDRRRCLDAGMNDFLAKPVNPDLLFATLLKWLARSDGPSVPAGAAGGMPADGMQADDLLRRLSAIPGLEPERGLATVAGKKASYVRFLRQFAQRRKDDMQVLRQHVAQREFAEAERLAHSLKGIAGSLGATRIQTMADELEGALRERRPDADIVTLAAALEAELVPLVVALIAALPEGMEPEARR